MFFKSVSLKNAKDFLKNNLVDIATSLFLFLLVFFVYLHNLSPSVYAGDVGDFLTAIIVRGIPHPSGYPLFTLLGILFNALPLNQPVAWKVGLISVISASFAVVLMYLIVNELIKNKTLALITAFTLAFFYPFWLYAELAETFALAYFFILLLLYLSILYFKYKNTYILYALSFSIGLSLSNHEVIALLFPLLAFLVLWKNLKILRPVVLLRCFILVLLGLLPYIYIPIAASHNPPLNWAGSVDFNNFYRLVTRQAYGWTSKIPITSMLLPLDAYRKYLLTELPLILIVVIPFGMVSMLKKKEIVLFIAIFFEFMLMGPLFTFYGGSPIVNNFFYGVFERFYTFSFLFAIIFFPFGIELIVNTITAFLNKISANFSEKQYYRHIFAGVFMLIPLSLFFHNASRTDLHSVWFGDYYAKDTLSSLPENSLAFFAGDTLFLNSLYIQHAYGNRKDVNRGVNIVTASGLDSFIAEKPVLLKKKQEILRSNKKVDAQNLNLLTIFSFPDDFSVITNAREIVDAKLSKSIVFMPYGLVFKIAGYKEKLLTEKEFIELQKKLWRNFRLNEKKFRSSQTSLGFHMLDIQQSYAKAAINIADYLTFHYGDIDAAKEWYEKALNFYPEEDAYKGLGYYYYEKHECKTSEDYVNKIISVDPKNKLGYKQLYLIYLNCYKDAKKAQEIKDAVGKLFDLKL